MTVIQLRGHFPNETKCVAYNVESGELVTTTEEWEVVDWIVNTDMVVIAWVKEM